MDVSMCLSTNIAAYGTIQLQAREWNEVKNESLEGRSGCQSFAELACKISFINTRRDSISPSSLNEGNKEFPMSHP